MKLSLKTILISTALSCAAVVPFAATSAMAGPMVHIQCPVPQLTRSVTTPLSNGWWQTTDVNGLQNTHISNVGGKPTLICDYGYAGQIMHLPPAFMSCQAVGGGFNCKSLINLNPPVHSSGTINIPQTYIADLDTGGLIASGPGDIWFEAVTATKFFLSPVNGAQMNVGGQQARGYGGCSQVSFGSGKVNLGMVPNGTHVCVRTNSGRIGEFRINKLWGPPAGAKTLNITYTTW